MKAANDNCSETDPKVCELPGARYVDPDSYGGIMDFSDKPFPAPKSYRRPLPERQQYSY